MLRQLLARGFRNLEPLDWQVEPGAHLLLGGTGAGKTSVLEAIYAAATTRSFRTVQIADCARRAEGAARSAGATVGDDASREDPQPGSFFVAVEAAGEARARLELAWSASRGLERRLNGERVPLARHVAAQPVLAWTAAEVEMLLGSPVARRRFLDRGVVYQRPGALQAFGTFRTVLAQKRSLLRDGGSRREVAAWNHLLAEAAAAVVELRAAFVEALREAFAGVAERSGLPVGDLAIAYRPSPASVDGAPGVLEALERAIDRELQARRPLLGPHRDRLSLQWRGEEIARRASAGERKALGLLLLAAQAAVIASRHPSLLLLVDDADAELDRRTLRAVWPLLQQSPQVLATSNRPEVWEELDAVHRWQVEAGRVMLLK